MDNISEFILHTTAEAKKRGLEISIASVSLAKPVEMPAAKAAEPTQKAIEDHSWISVPEAARMLRCNADLLYRRIRRGTIDCRRNKKGYWMVPSAIIGSFQKSHSTNPIPVRCVQTGVTYPSLSAAAKALRTDVTNLSEAIAAHKPCKNLTFEKVDS